MDEYGIRSPQILVLKQALHKVKYSAMLQWTRIWQYLNIDISKDTTLDSGVKGQGKPSDCVRAEYLGHVVFLLKSLFATW
jgi:hypothetical protein